jgi:hypothetical protein
MFNGSIACSKHTEIEPIFYNIYIRAFERQNGVGQSGRERDNHDCCMMKNMAEVIVINLAPRLQHMSQWANKNITALG